MANTAFEAITARYAFHTNEAVKKYDAIMVDTDGKFAKADGSSQFIGIAQYDAAAGDVATVVRGVFPAILSVDVTAGSRLTIDSGNAGRFKIATANDKTYGTAITSGSAGNLVSVLTVETGAIGFDTTVSPVTFTLSGDVSGAYAAGTTTIALASATDAATIYYKIGDAAEWSLYDSAIATTGLTGEITIKAYATKTGMATAAATSKTYVQAVTAGVAFALNDDTGGKYVADTTTITLSSATDSATIKYKLNDDAEWNTYSVAIATTGLSGDITLQAYASKTGYADSAVTNVTYEEHV